LLTNWRVAAFKPMRPIAHLPRRPGFVPKELHEKEPYCGPGEAEARDFPRKIIDYRSR
jgi:hypothetical protein